MAVKTYILGRDVVPGSFRAGSGETLDIVLVALPGVHLSLPLDVTIEGEGADVGIHGLYLCSGEDDLSLNITVRHLCGGSSSRQLIKGIAGGEAKISFHGLIYVQQDAQKTQALQENHNILLSETASVSTLPQLEIYADDVQCSHGATIGALSEDELFYLRSRGIPLDEARAMQMLSFVSPVLDCVTDESLRSEILSALSRL